jgi:hypothetical protein
MGVFRPALRSVSWPRAKDISLEKNMANLVSIDWSIEEFRRLISEQPKSSEAGSSIEKTVDVLSGGLASTSEAIDRAPPIENASAREAEAVSETLGPGQVFTQRKDRSVDLTVADVMALTASQAAGSDKPIASSEADRVRDIALDILNPEVAQPPNMLDRASNAKNAATSEVKTATPVPGTEDKGTASAAPLKSDVQEAAEVPPPRIAPLAFAEARKVELRSPLQELRSPLQKAIVEPDIHTSRADRERAIALRWILRDINGNRLNWWQPLEEDLKILIEFDLVEMKNGLPQLTVAGRAAI